MGFHGDQSTIVFSHHPSHLLNQLKGNSGMGEGSYQATENLACKQPVTNKHEVICIDETTTENLDPEPFHLPSTLSTPLSRVA